MNEKVKILLDHWEIPEDKRDLFEKMEIKKIVVSKKESGWYFFLKNPTFLPCEMIEKIYQHNRSLFPNVQEIKVYFEIEEETSPYLVTYFPFVLEQIKSDLIMPTLFEHCLVEENGLLRIQVDNPVEKAKIEEVLPKIEEWYHQFGYEQEIGVVLDESKREEVQQEIEKELQLHLTEIKKTPVVTVSKDEKNQTSFPKREKKEGTGGTNTLQQN